MAEKELPHKMGEGVYAKWPQSKFWYRAKVLNNKGNYYKIEFEDGSVDSVPVKHVKSLHGFRHSPSRGVSPGRKTRTPSASPSRRKGRSRSRSPSHITKAKAKSQSPVQSEKKKLPTSPKRSPSRQSARVAQQALEKEKPVEIATFQQDWKQDMNSKSSKGGKVFKTTETEFGGPIGAFLLIFFLPATVLLVNLACTKKSCTITKFPEVSNFGSFFDWRSMLIFLGWLVIQGFLSFIPIGKVAEGQTLRTGHKLSYRCNGFLALILCIAAFGGASYFGYPVTYIIDYFLRLAVCATIVCFALSVYLFVKARKAPNNALSPAGNTGNMIYDFFMGHELNPRIGSFDFKFFCELRPGLIGWALINLAIIAKDCEMNQGKPNPTLLLVAGSQIFYVADTLWFEEAILTTMDIIHEGFGFMLVFGDMVWVPFLYSLQPRFLQEHHQIYSYWSLAAFFILILTGYVVFRGSNSQKNSFRKNPFEPTLAHLKTIPTALGKPLLASGWWGFVRHPNYLGDLIIGLGWCLPCGFNHILPYFYIIYFTILIVHRALRDDRQCKKKYGAAWDRYCEHVKYRIIPYIF